MIFLIGGMPCSGKSKLVRDIFGELETPEYVEPMKLFPCEKRGDVCMAPDPSTRIGCLVYSFFGISSIA